MVLVHLSWCRRLNQVYGLLKNITQKAAKPPHCDPGQLDILQFLSSLRSHDVFDMSLKSQKDGELVCEHQNMMHVVYQSVVGKAVD